ncbi:hypothetical protein ACFQV4_30565 [Streptomyces thermocarboxydus]
MPLLLDEQPAPPGCVDFGQGPGRTAVPSDARRPTMSFAGRHFTTLAIAGLGCCAGLTLIGPRFG